MVNYLSINIDEYMKDSLSGQVSYLLMGVVYMEEACVCLLDAMWSQSDWILNTFDLEFLKSKLYNTIHLLESFGAKWPDIKKSTMISEFKSLSSIVIQRLELVEGNAGGTPTVVAERDENISSRLEELLFPMDGKKFVTGNSAENSPYVSQRKNSNVSNGINDLRFASPTVWQDHFDMTELMTLENYEATLNDLI
ncbi:unnamed protein product [Ambrosiozyma monospora]|uniref:Unnamed protein product n=1 Tax=Ambrosiozyma monospora TaxID=43982 RepID=A0ACB5T6V3_AMBMO|nr:unnamed protein product [Ambrosiozyma monospora]